MYPGADEIAPDVHHHQAEDDVTFQALPSGSTYGVRFYIWRQVRADEYGLRQGLTFLDLRIRFRHRSQH